MQIHELNEYGGSLDSGYFAIDDGNDTGKVQATQLLAPIEGEIENLEASLNGRIDNIIAGGTAPSVAEVTDARRGADGVNYPSLGDAIRTQVENIDKTLSEVSDLVTGIYYRVYDSTGTVSFPISILNGTAITLTNNRNKNASAQLKDANDATVQNIGIIPANSSVQVTVNGNGVTKLTGYCSGGYDVALFVENRNSIENKLLRDVRPVEEITVDIFEKGNLTKGDTYRIANRAVSKYIYCAEKNIVIGRKPSQSNAVLWFQEFTPNGEIKSQSSSWESDIYIPKGTLFRILITTTNSGTAPDVSIADILNCFVTASYENTPLDNYKALNYIKGTLYTNEGFRVYTPSDIAISVLDFISVGDEFIKINADNNFRYLIVKYDDEFSFISDTNWNTGINYFDCSDAAYIRIVLGSPNNETPIALSDISKLHVSKNKPISVEYKNDGNIESISKDGINDNSLAWAPSYPKSSPVSFKKAYDQGFRTLMVHVQFTSDGHPVLFHDENIAQRGFVKNMDGTAISGPVYIKTSTLAELDGYDFGIAFGAQYAGMKITRLSEGVIFAKNHGMKLIIEPTTTLSYAQEETVCNIVNEYGMSQNFGFHSYFYPHLLNVHTLLPSADLYWSPTSEHREQYWNDFLALKGDNNIYMYGNGGLSEAAILDAVKGGVKFITQNENGVEPDNYIGSLESYPYLSGVVSYVVPAYSGLQSR